MSILVYFIVAIPTLYNWQPFLPDFTGSFECVGARAEGIFLDDDGYAVIVGYAADDSSTVHPDAVKRLFLVMKLDVSEQYPSWPSVPAAIAQYAYSGGAYDDDAYAVTSCDLPNDSIAYVALGFHQCSVDSIQPQVDESALLAIGLEPSLQDEVFIALSNIDSTRGDEEYRDAVDLGQGRFAACAGFHSFNQSSLK